MFREHIFKTYESGENKLSFIVTVYTQSFDYVKMTRNIRVTVRAKCESGAVKLSQTLFNSYVDIFGERITFKDGIDLTAGWTNIFVTRDIAGIPKKSGDEIYDISWRLYYSNPEVGVVAANGTGQIDVGKFYLTPVGSVENANSLYFGDNLKAVSEMLGDGYTLMGAVKDGSVELASYQIKTGTSLLMDYTWLEPYPELNSREYTLVISAFYNDNELPFKSEVIFNVMLREEEMLPEATVLTSAESTNQHINGGDFYIRLLTRLKVDVTNLSAKCGAQIAQTEIIFPNKKQFGTSFSSDILMEFGEYPYRVRVTDSRGRMREYNGYVVVPEYYSPLFETEFQRVDDNGVPSNLGSHLKMKITPLKLYSFGGANSTSFMFVYKRKGGAEFGEPIPITPLEERIYDCNFSGGVEYDLQVRATDLFGLGKVMNFIITSDRVDMNISKGKVSVGKYTEKDNVFDSAWKVHSDVDLTVSDGSIDWSLKALARGFRDQFGTGLSTEEAVPCYFRYVTASTNAEIDKWLSYPFVQIKKRAMFMVFMNVTVSGLTLTMGTKVLLGYCTASSSVIKVIN